MNDSPSEALFRNTDPDTSREAAASVSINRLEQLVLDAMLNMPDGATSEELAERLHIDRVTVSPRLRPLANKGRIIESTDRRTGKSGRPSIVWKLPPASPPRTWGSTHVGETSELFAQ